MNTRRIYAIFLRQIFLLKSGSRLANIFYWSTIDLILWGFITIYLNQVGRANLNFAALILGTVILWGFLWRVQYGISMSYMEDLWSRNFMNLFATPLTVHEYAAGLMLTSIFNGVTSVIFTILSALLLFSYNIFQFGPFLVIFILILFVFGWAFGLLVTGIVLRLGPSAEIFAYALPALFGPFSSVFYPTSALPPFLQPIANVLPTAHVFEGMRSFVLYGSFDPVRLFLAAFLAILYFFLSYLFLIKSYRAILRRGTFTRFLTD